MKNLVCYVIINDNKKLSIRHEINFLAGINP